MENEKIELLDELKEYREQLSKLTEEESKQRDLYLKGLANGTIQGPPVGKASIDKQWLQYYDDDAIKVALPKMTAFDYLINSNQENLDHCALNFLGLKISYKQLFDKIEQTAKSLVELGVKKGDVVVINCVTLPQTVYLLYALNKIGAIANLTDLRTDANGMKHYLNEGNSKFLFTLDTGFNAIKPIISETSVEKIVFINPTDEVPLLGKFLNYMGNRKKLSKQEIINQKEEKTKVKHNMNENHNIIDWKTFYKKGTSKTQVVSQEYEENSPAAIVHTSGTTSLPKSVVLTNDNFNAMPLQYSVSDFKYSKGESLLNIIPMFTAYGAVNALHMPLCLGMTDIVYPKVVNEDFTEIIRKFKPNHVIAIPMHWEYLLTNPNMQNVDMSFLKTAACGGDKLNIELEKKLNTFLEQHNSPSKIVKGYGMTEVSACAVTNTNNTNKLGSVGIPLVKNNIKIIDPDTKLEVSTGNKGEVCIATPSLMKEYLNNPDETNEAIQIHDDGKRWIHSGDIGHLSYDGKLDIDGRLKRLIIRRGFKVSAVAIEDAIMSYQEVETCAVVKAPHNEDGEVPVAFIVPKKKDNDNMEYLLKEVSCICKNMLPNYFVPVLYDILPELPHTDNGKVDVIALEQLAENKIQNSSIECSNKQR